MILESWINFHEIIHHRCFDKTKFYVCLGDWLSVSQLAHVLSPTQSKVIHLYHRRGQKRVSIVFHLLLCSPVCVISIDDEYRSLSTFSSFNCDRQSCIRERERIVQFESVVKHKENSSYMIWRIAGSRCKVLLLWISQTLDEDRANSLKIRCQSRTRLESCTFSFLQNGAVEQSALARWTLRVYVNESLEITIKRDACVRSARARP